MAKAKSAVKLTKTVVGKAVPIPGKAQTFIHDSLLPGFALRITAAGVKTYILEYRTREEQSRRQSLGRHGVLTAEDARDQATAILAEVAKGADPLRDRRALKAERTVADLAEEFIREHVERRNKPSTVREERRLFNKVVVPKLGPVKLSRLTRPEVSRWHKAEAKRGTSANRALAHLSRACRYAMEQGWLETNPCHGLTRHKEKARERFFTEEELAAIAVALRELEAEKSITPAITFGVRLIALTGIRRSEAMAAKWAHLDMKQGVLMLTDAKTGTRSAKLSPQAFQFLSGAERMGPHLIPGNDPKKAMSASTFHHAFARVLDRAGVEDGSLHVFRHTLATYMAQHGDSVPIIAGAGGWKTFAMVQRYVNLHSVGEAHPETAAVRIASALGLSSGANVIPFAKAS